MKKPLWQLITVYIVIAVLVYSGMYLLVINKNIRSVSASQKVNTAGNATGVQRLTVTGSEFSFDPAVITVKKDLPVLITFINSGKYSHNLVISGLNTGSNTILPGQQDTFSFIPMKPGQYTFSCAVPGHTEKGMTGTLNVQ